MRAARIAKPDQPLRANGNFILLWSGQFVSMMGDRLAMVAFPWLVWRSTSSGLSTAIILMVYSLPYVLFGAVAGVVLDRLDKRLTMIIADVLRALLVCSVPLVAERSLTAVFVLAFATASVSVFFDPGKLALLPEIVAGKSLLRANSLLSTGEAITEIVGFAAAGFTLAAISITTSFRIDAATFVVSALALALMRYTPAAREAQPKERSVSGDIRDGITFLWRHVGLRANTILVVTAITGIGAAYPLMFLLAVKTFDGGPRAFGIMEAAIAVGYLAGSLRVAAMAARLHKGLSTAIGMVVMGAMLVLTGAASGVTTVIVPLVLLGAANAAAMIAIDTYFQQQIPEHLRGRVLGLRFTLTHGAYAASVLAGGALAGLFDIRLLLMIAGVVVAVPGLVALFVKEVRTAD